MKGNESKFRVLIIAVNCYAICYKPRYKPINAMFNAHAQANFCLSPQKYRYNINYMLMLKKMGVF